MDLSSLNKFLKTGNLKMETPETMRTSLQPGEWVMSIDFKDVYFHILIKVQSRKYLCFHIQHQLKALLFDLSTAPLVFTVVAKEVRLMALPYKGIRIDQYLDGLLVRARSHHQIPVSSTTNSGSSVSGTRLNSKHGEIGTGPKQVFNFIGFQFDLKEGKARPTLELWQALNAKIQELISRPVRQLMSLIGWPTATKKQVHVGQLQIMPIQWHLKNNWRVPESLEKVIPIPRSPKLT